MDRGGVHLEVDRGGGGSLGGVYYVCVLICDHSAWFAASARGPAACKTMAGQGAHF